MINWTDPQIWILVSFAIFIIGIGIPAARKGKYQLDQRSHMIARQVREVADLYEETLHLLKKQKQEFASINDLVGRIKMETEQEIEEIEKIKKKQLVTIKKIHDSRLDKQIKLVKEQYINDVVDQALIDVIKVVNHYIKHSLSAKQLQEFNDDAINLVHFASNK